MCVCGAVVGAGRVRPGRLVLVVLVIPAQLPLQPGMPPLQPSAPTSPPPLIPRDCFLTGLVQS